METRRSEGGEVPGGASPPVYVINLARSPERRAHVVAQLAKTDVVYELVEGVDARDLDIDDRDLVDAEFVTQRSFRPGAVGCALSHLNVYRKIVAHAPERALVLEDDVLLPADLGPLAAAIASHMSGAEIVLLNFHAPEVVQLSRQGSVPVPNSRLLAYPIHLRALTSAGAYLITREACRRLERAILPVRVFADDWEHFVQRGVLDRLRCVAPMPVTNSPEFRTTIDYYAKGSLQLHLREVVSRAGVPLLHRMLVSRRLRQFEKRGWTVVAEIVDKPSVAGP